MFTNNMSKLNSIVDAQSKLSLHEFIQMSSKLHDQLNFLGSVFNQSETFQSLASLEKYFSLHNKLFGEHLGSTLFPINEELFKQASILNSALNLDVWNNLLPRNIASISKIVDVFSLLQKSDEFCETGGTIICKNISTVSEEDVNEFNTDLEDFTKDTDSLDINWQQKIYAVAMKWKERNPIIFCFIVCVVVPCIVSTIYDAYKCYYVKNKSEVKNNYIQNSSVIYHLEINQQINIIDSVPYYYKIIFFDNDTNFYDIGWVAKRNIELLND